MNTTKTCKYCPCSEDWEKFPERDNFRCRLDPQAPFIFHDPIEWWCYRGREIMEHDRKLVEVEEE